MGGASLDADVCGIDGCSIPTWAVPVENLAAAFAKVASGSSVSPERAAALTRLRKACCAHPMEVAGTDRFCTDVMARFGDAAYVKTGAEGVKKYETVKPDLVVSDLMMPGMHGFDVCRKLRDSDPAVKILAISGKTTPIASKEAYHAGASEFMFKPFVPHQFLDKVEEMLSSES